MMSFGILAAALGLDAVMGEPGWLWKKLPHPAVLTGQVIDWAERRFNHGPKRRLYGVALVVALVCLAVVIGLILAKLGWIIELICVAILLAHKSLIEHVRAVAQGLRISLPAGRSEVANIVGRDTASMDSPAVARAAIESAAENFSDGVIAPAFWFLLAGLPGILTYKLINTADSMIGHKTERFAEFGWAAARFDDLLNLIPARLTAALIAACYQLWPVWGEITADARLHRSPNAGWPEAALSRALEVALSGPRSYDGQMQDFAYVNAAGRKTATVADIDASCAALWRVWGAMVAGLILLALLTRLIF